MDIIKDLETFYRKTYAIKVKTLTKMLRGDRALAEDVVQEAFIRAINYSHLYNVDKGTIQAWFNAILFNTLRSTQRSERQKLDLSREISVQNNINPVYEEKYSEYWWGIYNLIQKIPNQKHKRIIELFFIQGYSAKEIAEMEGTMTQTNVTTIVLRFRESLRQKGWM